jgi:hypothetical protein
MSGSYSRRQANDEAKSSKVRGSDHDDARPPGTYFADRMPAKARLLVPLLVLLALLVGAAPTRAATKEFKGEVLGCKYTLEADLGGDSFSAQVGECGSSLDPEGELDGSWENPEGATETTVALTSVKLSILGQEKEFPVGYTFTLPVNVDQLIEAWEEAETLFDEGKKTKAEVEAELKKLQDRLQEALKSFEGDVVDAAAGALLDQAGSGIPDMVEHFNGLFESLNSGCEEHGTNGLNPFCSPYMHTRRCPTLECPNHPGRANVGAVAEGAGEDAEDSNSDQEALCPVFNSTQDDAVFVCIPSVVYGELDVGDKPLVIIGGGALMAVPDLQGESKISSNTAIVQLGGAVVGDNLKLDAPDIAIAGGYLNAIESLEYDGDDVSIGEVKGESLLTAIPDLPEDWTNEIDDEVESIGLHAKIDLPAFVTSRKTTVKVTKEFLLSAGSTLSGAGLGRLGADFETGVDPSGETEEFGGSHGGLGGYTVSSMGVEDYDHWYAMEGRSPTSDSPFKPTEPGDGGGGDPGGALGLSGGGVVAIEAPEATVRIDGRLDVSGLGTGVWNSTSNGDHGGGGAGGSVYIATEELAGSGTIDADGGSHCSEEGPEVGECVNGFGGSGGGGRIAALFEEDPGWSGLLEARGGVDRRFKHHFGEQFVGTGGAGTIFTRSVAFKENGEVEKGTGAFPEGTLTIDGGRAAGDYPPPDGTPIANAWSSPQRRLLITGEARVYGEKLEYGEIAMTDGAVLTAGIANAALPIPKKLTVKAGTLSVDDTSQVTMSGRGYAGGDGETGVGPGEAAPGQTPSTEGHGGSHAGVGGATSAFENPGPVSGSTYDSVEAPDLPGGGGGGGEDPGTPGGGVLDVTAGRLVLNGRFAADGENGAGPTALEPAPFDFRGGAGAGGSVLVNAEELSGSGAVTADGGDACLTQSPPLLEAGACNAPDGSGGGGGGGRVALIAAADCGWTGTLGVAGGVDEQAEVKLAAEPQNEALGQDVVAMRGSAGSVFFPAPTGTCSAPPSEPPASEPPAGSGNPPAAGSNAPPPSPPPSNAFKVVSKKAGKKGSVKVVVAVPGAGSLSGTETAVLKLPRKHHAAKSQAVGQASAHPAGAGKVTLTFALSSAARAYLNKNGSLPVTIAISFKPTGGSAATKSLRATLKSAV